MHRICIITVYYMWFEVTYLTRTVYFYCVVTYLVVYGARNSKVMGSIVREYKI